MQKGQTNSGTKPASAPDGLLAREALKRPRDARGRYTRMPPRSRAGGKTNKDHSKRKANGDAREAAKGTAAVRLKDVKVGSLDKRGEPITEVLCSMRDFKIYKTRKGINPHFSNDQKTATQQLKRYMDLGMDLAHMNHLVHLSRYRGAPFLQLTPRSDEVPSGRRGKTARAKGDSDDPGPDDATEADPNLIYYEREIARCIARALIGDTVGGKATLAALTRRLEKRLRNQGRVTYFMLCLILACLMIAAAAPFMALSPAGDRQEMALAVIMGSVGALLSTAVGLRTLRIDASATASMNWIYGFQRMLVDVLGAVVLYIAIRAEVFAGVVPGLHFAADGGPGLDPYKLAFASVLAGFSERLVPNLLDRHAGKEDEETRA